MLGYPRPPHPHLLWAHLGLMSWEPPWGGGLENGPKTPHPPKTFFFPPLRRAVALAVWGSPILFG